MRHIRHFSVSWSGRDVFDLVFDLVFEQGEWQTRAFLPLATPLGPQDDSFMYSHWLVAQDQVKFQVKTILEDSAWRMRKFGSL